MIFLVLLQEVGLPVASFISITIGAFVALAGFLIRDAYMTLKNEIKHIKEIQEGLEAKAVIKHALFEEKLNDTNIKILQEINAISLKLAEFKHQKND